MGKTILSLSANPTNTENLRLDLEIKKIEEGLRKAQKRDSFKFEKFLAVSPSDIGRLILETNPNIVHFSGHASEQDGIVLENEIGTAKYVTAQALSKLFELFSDIVECVVLNACYTEIQAEAISEHIDYVVGMNSSITDEAALGYAINFYEALGAGKSIEFAHNYGCRMVETIGVSGSAIPILKQKKEMGVILLNFDFSKLRRYLEQENWKLADLETKDLILKSAKLSLNEAMSPKAINNLPCEVFKMIDKLWVDSSNGHFGFSPQIEIYKTLGRDQLRFGKEVGWRNSSDGLIESVRKLTDLSFFGWIPYESLNFSLQAKKGHLPALGQHGYGSNGKVDLIQVIENKMTKC